MIRFSLSSIWSSRDPQDFWPYLQMQKFSILVLLVDSSNSQAVIPDLSRTSISYTPTSAWIFSELVLYLTISVRITSCTSCPSDEFFLLCRIVHSGKSKSLCSLLKWLGFYPCLSIVTRRCDVWPHPLLIGMTDINLQPSELCSLILSCNSLSFSSTCGFICFLTSNLTLKVLYSYKIAMYVAFVGDLFTHLWYE